MFSNDYHRFGFSQPLASGPHPADSNIVVIFVIGGISLKEVSQIQQVLDEYDKNLNLQVLIGSTGTLFVPDDIFAHT